ncbi:hypothetical protein MMC25_003076 [Agyrium rufum]|nr:hypothetical protein [Agyrium rufum]
MLVLGVAEVAILVEVRLVALEVVDLVVLAVVELVVFDGVDVDVFGVLMPLVCEPLLLLNLEVVEPLLLERTLVAVLVVGTMLLVVVVGDCELLLKVGVTVLLDLDIGPKVCKELDEVGEPLLVIREEVALLDELDRTVEVPVETGLEELALVLVGLDVEVPLEEELLVEERIEDLDVLTLIPELRNVELPV